MTALTPPSLHALLADSVDYAGLFPPAGLALEPAFENHSSYILGKDAWLVGHFVLPAANWLEAVPLLAGRFDAANPLRLSALGQKAPCVDGFLENLRTSLRQMVNFQRAQRDSLTLDRFEAALPPVPAPVLGELLWQAAGLIETALTGAVRAFWEIPFSEDLPATIYAIADHNARVPLTAHTSVPPRFQADGRVLHDAPITRTFRCQPFGAKLRTGGMEAAHFPTPGQLAGALVAARDAGVALKFTAGLHHPLRHFDEGLGTHLHGFLNVFAAGVLAREHRLDATETQAILEDERPESFRFDAAGFAWCGRHVPTAALAAHREFVTSFGSCSFDEPRDDLRHLGLLV